MRNVFELEEQGGEWTQGVVDMKAGRRGRERGRGREKEGERERGREREHEYIIYSRDPLCVVDSVLL